MTSQKRRAQTPSSDDELDRDYQQTGSAPETPSPKKSRQSARSSDHQKQERKIVLKTNNNTNAQEQPSATEQSSSSSAPVTSAIPVEKGLGPDDVREKIQPQPLPIVDDAHAAIHPQHAQNQVRTPKVSSPPASQAHKKT